MILDASQVASARFGGEETRGCVKIGAADKFLRQRTRARGTTVYGIDIESQASRQEQAGCLAGRRRREAANTPTVGMPTATAGEGSVRLIRAAAKGRKSERDGASGRAEAGRRDATRQARGNMAASVVRARARRGNVAARPSRTPGDPTNTHGRTENGVPEKERIPFCRAGGDEKRRG